MTLYPSSDQPELVNKPTILYNWQNLDGRGIPKVGDLKDRYKRVYEQLFLARDRVYFIMDKPYGLIKEEGDYIIFKHTTTEDIKKLSRIEVYSMMDETFTIGNTTIPKVSIGYFGSGTIADLFHKLEIDYNSLYDDESRYILLERYDNIFLNVEEGKYPSSQRAINSLFYLSILLDFDPNIQKNLAKYFINNSLNTLYREEDHHYGLHKNYNAQEVWKKMGLSIKGIKDGDKNIYLSVDDCKKIADRFGFSTEEFSDVLYDVCLFKLGDDTKASASFHRKTDFGLEDAKKHMTPEKKQYIENIQYICNEGLSPRSGIFYNIKRYDFIKATESLGITLQEQQRQVEEEKKTQDTIWADAVKSIGEDFLGQYSTLERDVDIDTYDSTHNGSIKDYCVYLASQGNSLFITDTIEDKTIIGSLHMRLSKTSSINYDHEENRPLFGNKRKYEADIFSSPNIQQEHIYSILTIFEKKSHEIDLSLYSLSLGDKK